MNIFLKSYFLFTSLSHLNFMCFDESLSCVFLANYVRKCQTSFDPYGPIFQFHDMVFEDGRMLGYSKRLLITQDLRCAYIFVSFWLVSLHGLLAMCCRKSSRNLIDEIDIVPFLVYSYSYEATMLLMAYI